MHSMLWSWSLFLRSMNKLTANFFLPRVKGLGMTWRNTHERSTFSRLKLSSSSYRHDNLYTPWCSKSRIILIVFIMSPACVLSVDRCMKHMCGPCLMRRINCFPSVLIRGMETHRKQDRRCQEYMREGLKGTAWLSLVVLLLIFNAYLWGFCRNHRELNPL